MADGDSAFPFHPSLPGFEYLPKAQWTRPLPG